ncbi:hypothetical protein SAMN05660461_2516 [Chitinophaga ginsengisegetis]|uniref:Uncharacterized protein n=1 Tax=Chitinophaga ginsengisegetis TaxID=393003 RepID=A0A1T5NPZ8_9BACT|nr:hypothetical protein [Chitinophaga ginsengisegetis]MDR6565690.1 hypothetical protein [Chitinophaga ginsengisegetis]MDR6645419.1 hypothetical protein [Chitinophaga ginsengisegetis]MDR6651989.1 hypothetical protein [Chitinophaga ginsengisegetis]SKD02397.1 hypothetical protein SAMN05660461_2516 [Chitinophaga ginsengisegetis]
MDFRFKLYRVTTAIVLMISGIFTFMLLSSVLFLGTNFGSIVSLLSMGACFIHSVLSLYLQRSLLLPEIPLKESTPGGMRFMGTVGLIFSILLILSGLTILLVTPEQMKAEIDNLPADQQAAVKQTLVAPIGVFLLVMGSLFTLNIVLSFRYLRQWLQLQSGRNEEKEE